MNKTCGFLLCLPLLAGCAIAPQVKAPAAAYDFGLARPAAKDNPARIRAVLLVPDMAAPSWLDTPGILYRLAYHDPARPQAYANSRWIAPPAALLTLRLRSRIANAGGIVTAADGARAHYLLRTELEEFSQVFDSMEKSRAVVRLRASLLSQSGQALFAQRSFAAERAAPTPDAQGAVRSLTGTSDEIIDALLDWLAAKLGTGN